MSAGARVLVAPDKFKGSLDATSVAEALARGILGAVPDAQVVRRPVADGGDGTLEVLEHVGFVPVPVTVDGPTGNTVTSCYARRADTAVVELARLAGLQALPGGDLAPLDASTFGLGQAIAHAVDAGCRTVLVAVGGSASTDGGAGLLQALGAKLTNVHGCPITPGAAGLAGLHQANLDPARTTLSGVKLEVLCDVDNPLLGPRGAARVFGPQKGLNTDQTNDVDDGLANLADLLDANHGLRNVPGAGAAGGAAFALLTLGARLRSGAGVILDVIGLQAAIDDADLVVVGEGSLDEQTLGGKAPAAVTALARSSGVPVVAATGRSTLTQEQLTSAGIATVHQLFELEPDLEKSHQLAAKLLEQLGHKIAREHLSPGSAPHLATRVR